MAIDRAHIRLVDGNWTFIKSFDGPNGFTRTEDDRRVDISKAPIGYQVGNDKLVAATFTQTDNSTPSAETTTEDTGWVVNATSATRSVTKRDKTAQEIAGERQAALAELDVARRDLQYATFVHTKEITSVMFALARQITPTLTLSQFAAQWENNKNLITMDQFKTYLGRNQS